ncbi:MAG: deaminase [Candidatus Microsaccharimonas sp.]
MTNFEFDWSDLAFGSKRPLKDLKATFIAAPREISQVRFTQIVKEYLPKGNIILGISKEAFVEGLEGQPQFAMLQLETVQLLIDKINASSPHKVYILHYFQREIVSIIEKIKPSRAVFINGSWHHSFHTLPVYYLLTKERILFELAAAFSNEDEARAYEQVTDKKISPLKLNEPLDDTDIIQLTDKVAKASYDNGFQTGTILAKKTKHGYEPLLSAFNKVVPYQTYAMLHGASRETHFSPPNDLNHYDTIHAEMLALIEAAKQGISLHDTTLFVNLMPCPACARALSLTDIKEVVYRIDHSEGYAVDLLTKAGKSIRRMLY